MRFAQLARSLEIQGIIGAELTLKGGQHITLLASNRGAGNDSFEEILARLVAETEQGPADRR